MEVMTDKALTEEILRIMGHAEEDPATAKKIFETVSNAPGSSERDGLLALIYHDGIGTPIDLEKSFGYAMKAIEEGRDACAYYVLGYMCDNAETPDQAEGGPRQQFDHYDAEHFYELCAKQDTPWKKYACNWLGDYFLNMARGGDPELGIEYLEQIADEDVEAAETLADHYWDIVMPDYTDDKESADALFRWTKKAAELDGDEDFIYRLGWLFADGIGCRKSFPLAMKYFEEAYMAGDWRGAESIANLLQEKLATDPENLSAEEKAEFDTDISKWRQRALKMKEESDAEEPDTALDED